MLLDEYAITVNLAPASVRKSDAALDLAIALGILEAIGKIPSGCLSNTLVLGELSLDGQVQPIRGVLPQLCGAVERGVGSVILPEANCREGGLVQGIAIQLVSTLPDVVRALGRGRTLPLAHHTAFDPQLTKTAADLRDVRGQSTARRALENCRGGRTQLAHDWSPLEPAKPC